MTRIESAPSSSHAWERWRWIWSVIFYGSLMISVSFIVWMEDLLHGSDRWWALVLVAGAALLHGLINFVLPRQGWHVRKHVWIGAGYTVALIAIIGLLVIIHPIFYFLLGGYFSQLFYTLPSRWAVPIAMALMLLLGVLGTEQPVAQVVRQPYFWLWVLSGLIAVLISLWFNAIIRQSGEREELIRQLQQMQSELAATEREAGVLAERQRLAREIHDTLAQGFISVITHLEAAEQALNGDLRVVHHHITQARQTARANLGEARRVVQNLRPEVLEGSSLPDAIRRVAAHWSQSSGVSAMVTITGVVRALHPEAEVTLLRAVQEALVNVRKHANAHEVTVTLSYLPDRVLLDVQDDGDGVGKFTQTSTFSAGFGLRAMRERVSDLGGSLLIESEPGEGTTLVVEIPLLGIAQPRPEAAEKSP